MANETPSRRVLELGQVSADLVILTVLPEEYAAALSCLHDVAALRGTHGTPNTYAWRLGRIWSGLHDAAFSVAVGKGTQTTSYGALVAKQAIQLFAPSYVVFVGIGGGFDLDGQRHGDVAVSSVVHGYDYGKVDTGGFSPRGDFTYRCDGGLVRAADTVNDATWWREADNPDRKPRARTGPIASGDKLIDDPWEWCLDAWAGSYAEIQAGPVDPCHQGDTRVGSRVVRGGSWDDGPGVLRSAFRGGGHPRNRLRSLGLRVVCVGSGQPDAH